MWSNWLKMLQNSTFWARFSYFFEVAVRARLDLQRREPNPCFCWQAQYFQGFANFADKQKSNQIQRKIAPTMRRERAAWKNIDFLVSGSNAASILVSSACSRTFPGALFGIRMRLCGLSGTCQGRLQNSEDVFTMLLRAMLRPRSIPEPILTRFWMSRKSLEIDLEWSLTSRAVESGASMCPNVSRKLESDVAECVKTN